MYINYIAYCLWHKVYLRRYGRQTCLVLFTRSSIFPTPESRIPFCIRLFSQARRRKDTSSTLISAGGHLNSENSPVPLKYATVLGQISVQCRESTERCNQVISQSALSARNITIILHCIFESALVWKLSEKKNLRIKSTFFFFFLCRLEIHKPRKMLLCIVMSTVQLRNQDTKTEHVLHVWTLWEDIFTIATPAGTQTFPHWETIYMRILWEGVCSCFKFTETHAHSYRRETVFMWTLWKVIHSVFRLD